MGALSNDPPDGPDDKLRQASCPRYRILFAQDNVPGIDQLCSPELRDLTEEKLASDLLVEAYENYYGQQSGFVPPSTPLHTEVSLLLRENRMKFFMATLPTEPGFSPQLCNELRPDSHLRFFNARVNEKDPQSGDPLVSWLVDARNIQGHHVSASYDLSGKIRWQKHDTGPAFMSVLGRAGGDDFAIETLYSYAVFIDELKRFDHPMERAKVYQPGKEGSQLFYRIVSAGFEELGLAKNDPLNLCRMTIERKNDFGSPRGTEYHLIIRNGTASIKANHNPETLRIDVEARRIK